VRYLVGQVELPLGPGESQLDLRSTLLGAQALP
jgi:hypothetical protein